MTDADNALVESLAEITTTAKVIRLQAQMLSLPQAPVASVFAHGGGIAAKAVLMRAGTMAVGAMHRF